MYLSFLYGLCVNLDHERGRDEGIRTLIRNFIISIRTICLSCAANTVLLVSLDVNHCKQSEASNQKSKHSI